MNTSIMTSVGEWEGQVGDVWAAEWRRTDRSFSELSTRLFSRIADVAPDAGTAIDIGCGAAETAIGLALSRPGLSVTGVDISDGLLEIGRGRADGIPNIDFIQGDAAVEAGHHKPVDLYISRHGVMFFDDPVAAFSAFHHAASPGAPIVFSCFQDWTLNGFAHDIAGLVDAAPPADAPGPFAFASHDRVAGILASGGWRDAEAIAVDFNYIVGHGDDPVEDAMSFMHRIGSAARAIRLADADKRQAIDEGLRSICEKRRQGDTVQFSAAAWIWTAWA
jgi:SAM-dependent methyltransferase